MTTFRGTFAPNDAPVYVRYSFAYHATENGKGTWTDTLVGGKVRFRGDIRPTVRRP